MIQQGLKVELRLAGCTGHQVFQACPAEGIAVEQHLLQALAQLGIRILHQPSSEVGIGRSKNLELRIHAQGNAFKGHQGANDQGVIRRHTEGKFVHHPGHVIGDGLEVHPIHTRLEGLAEDFFEGRNDRFEVHVLRQKTEGDEILGELSKVAIDQMHHGLNQSSP